MSSVAIKLIVLVSLVKLSITKPPNIVIIIADDLGWNDVGFHGSNQIPTPNIDALAYNGVVLNQFYTQATCTPSRAALLTGQYPMRMGFQGFPTGGGEDRALPQDTPTIAERLQHLGYNTYLIGKWHLGYACQGHTPTHRGFDEFFGYYNGYVGYFDRDYHQGAAVGHDFRNGPDADHDSDGTYLVDVLTKRASEVVRKHENSKEAMFVVVSHLAPHTGEPGKELGVKNQTEVDEDLGYIGDQDRRNYADIVRKLDDSIGEIVKTLFETNQLENTVIFFFSDNGGQTYGLYANKASNWPLKGLKFTLFNGGIRTPSLVYSPRLEQKSSINNNLIHITDLYKTIYSIGGGDSSSITNLDSIDFSSNLFEDPQLINRKEVLLEIDEIDQISGYIYGKYKLLKGIYREGIYDNRTGETGRDPKTPDYNIEAILNSPTNIAISKLQTSLTEETILLLRRELDLSKGIDSPNLNNHYDCSESCLFDVEDDSLESKNLASKLPEVVENLKRKIEFYRQFLVPRGEPKMDPKSDPKLFNRTWSSWLEDSKSCQKISIRNKYKLQISIK